MGERLVGWSGSGLDCKGTGDCAVAVETSKAVTATFSQQAGTRFNLALTIAGELFAIWPKAGSMPTVPSAPVLVLGSHVSPGRAFRIGAASLMMSEPESSTASGTSGIPSPSIRSTTPFLPNLGSGMPVFASSDARW